MRFQPSRYSRTNPTEETLSGGSTSSGAGWAAALSAAGGTASDLISGITDLQLQKRQAAADKAAAKQAVKIAAAQEKLALAQQGVVGLQAQIASIGGTKFLYGVGGLVLSVGFIATVVYLLKKPKKAKKETA